MYRRGVFHVVAFLLVALVGSALAQGGTQLLATSPGPHAIGGGTNTRHQLLITGTYAPAGGGINTLMHLDGTLSPLNPGVDGAGFHVGTPTLTKANSGTHNTFAGLYVDPLVVGAGAAALTNAASAYISGAPSGATNNYALWVGRGQTRFGGDVQV